MQHTHRFQVTAPVRTVYDAFSHLEQLAPCFPGVTLTGYDDERLTGTLAVKLGALPLHYTGTATYRERNASRHRVVVQAQGEDDRGLGGATAVVTTELTGRRGGTDVRVHVELELTGTPGRYGTAVADDVVTKLFDQFSSALSARLDTGAGGAAGPGSRLAALGAMLRRYGPAVGALGAGSWLGLRLLRRRG